MAIKQHSIPRKFEPIRRRRYPPACIVVHETAGRTADSAIEHMRSKGLGVHFIVDEHADTIQCADLMDVLYHCGPSHNAISVGVEIVNPYYPRLIKANDPWTDCINAEWADGGRYVVPTIEQLEACYDTCLDVALECGIDIVFPGSDGSDGIHMGRIEGYQNIKTGILAHTYWAHADGAFPLAYMWLRNVHLFDPDEAYDAAIKYACDDEMLPQCMRRYDA